MSCSYSHRRAKSKGDITPPTERVQQDADLDRERLADMVLVMVLRTKRHRERDVDALRALVLDMAGAY